MKIIKIQILHSNSWHFTNKLSKQLSSFSSHIWSLKFWISIQEGRKLVAPWKSAMVPNINLDQLHISDIQAFLITTQVKSNRITFIRSLCINKFMFLIAPSFSRQRFLSASLSALRWLSRLLCCSRAFSRSSCLRLDSKPFLLPTWKTKNTKRLSSTHHKELLSLWFPNSIEEALHVNLHGALYKCKIIHFEVTIRILHQLMISVKV